ncbi:hypothetical protein ROU88_00840 [Macrococcus capreoli]|uniref:hypothetical protein n=1 Tax=Macrococcus capreoli TaxID=2982690 RepID=UPI0021D5CA7B|nr:hypothetical protein [Macrococcus sp. TMW 2.2395]MCU7556663.1 hypothetical protein [Macrococcus sp. TMW 2.2395]
MIFFTQPIKDIEDFIVTKQNQFQTMFDHLQLLIMIGFGGLLLIMLSILYFNYKIYRQMSQQHIDRIKLEVEKELLKKYELDLKQEYKENLPKHQSIDR